MSWAKVKKINSDLSVSLNDLIDSKDYGTDFELRSPTCAQASTTNTDWTTIIDVEGSGVACCGIVRETTTTSDVPASVRITVDGVVLEEFTDNALGGRHLNGGYVYGLVNEDFQRLGNWGRSSFAVAQSDRTLPIPLEPKIGFESSFKYEIQRGGDNNITGTAVVIA